MLAFGAGAAVAQANDRPRAADGSSATVADVVYLQSVAWSQCLALRVDPTIKSVHGQDCADDPRQRWERIERGTDTFVLRNVGAGVCLGADRAEVTQRTCDYESPHQQWTFVPAREGTFELKNGSGNVAGTILLDTRGLTAGPDSGTTYHRFRVSEKVPPAPVVRDVVQLKSVALGGCLGYHAYGRLARVSAGSCTDAAHQRWERIERGDNTFVLRNVDTSECLFSEGLLVYLWTCEFESSQQWTFVPAANGTVELKNGNTGNVLDTIINESSGVIARAGNGRDAQRFEVIPVTQG